MVTTISNPFGPRGTVSEIVELRVYPIKSCRGIKLDRTTLTRQGLDLDRRWMFVDEKKHEFITIRQKSQMTLIDTAISTDGQELIISIHGNVPWIEDSCKTVRSNATPALLGLSAGANRDSLDIYVVSRCAIRQNSNLYPNSAENHKKDPGDIVTAYR